MDQLTHIFTDSRFVWACVGFLLFLAVITYLFWSRRTAEAVAVLRRAIVALKAFDDAPDSAADCHDLNQKVSAVLSNVPSMQLSWSRWVNTMRPFVKSDGSKVIAARRPASEYFTLTSWERGLAMHWYQALPNYLVGLGLCFTFFGVIVVISAAAKNLGVDSSKQSEHLQNLLSAASVKFATSLAAVFASVVYSFLFRWRRNAVDRHISEFVAELNHRVIVLDPSVLMLEVREESQRQTRSLEIMTNRISTTVGEHFQNATQVLRDGFSGIETSVNTTGKQLGDKCDAVRQSIDGLSGGIVEATSRDMERLAASVVGALDSTLKEHFNAIASSLEGTCGEIEATREAFSEIVEHTSKAREEFTTLAGEIMARTLEVSDLLLKAEEEIETRLRGASTAARLVETSISTAAEKAASMEAVCAGLSKAASALEKAGTDWQDTISVLSSLAAANGEASENVSASTDALRQQWELQGSRISEIDTHLAATISAVQAHFDGYSHRLREYTQEIDSQLGRALGSFGASIDSLSDAPERFVDAGEKLQRAAQEAVESLATFKNLSGLVAALDPIMKLDSVATALMESVNELRAVVTSKNKPSS